MGHNGAVGRNYGTEAPGNTQGSGCPTKGIRSFFQRDQVVLLKGSGRPLKGSGVVILKRSGRSFKGIRLSYLRDQVALPKGCSCPTEGIKSYF